MFICDWQAAESAGRKPITSRPTTSTASSEEESESESEEPEEETNNYKYVPNSSTSPMKTLNMSQSHQILMDGTALSNPSPDSKKLFGIARQAPPSKTTSALASSPNHVVRTNQTLEPQKPVALVSPPNPSATKVDRNTELARWMGKSPPAVNNMSNGTPAHSAPVESADNSIKVQPIAGSQQPFQGLFAQLKRSSVDTAPTGPLSKRVAWHCEKTCNDNNVYFCIIVTLGNFFLCIYENYEGFCRHKWNIYWPLCNILL